MKCCSENATANYVPPPVGNGELSIMMDMEGIQRQKNYHKMIPSIWWAGRRYNTYNGALISFGHLVHDLDEPKHWEQELDVVTGSINCNCDYAGSETLTTNAFVHLNHPLLVMRKKFGESYTLRYRLAHSNTPTEFPDRMSCMVMKHGCGVDITYRIAGLKDYGGIISFWCDSENDLTVETSNNEFSITATGTEATFYLSFCDTIDFENYAAASLNLKALATEEKFEGLFRSQTQAWADYWAESYVHLSSKRQEDAYYTSQYHLRISSTRWSIPTGIFNTHWDGRYFPFDDYFSFMGLVTSGHLSMAKKIPSFRHGLLSLAQFRAHTYFDKKLSGARFSWEQLEDGTESSPPGFWQEHIFHQSNISLTAWYYWLYSADAEFLKEIAYPILSNCAEFARVQSVMKVGNDRYIVGKCTDLERLGPARHNAYMTTCGIIATFDAAANAADILGIDSEKSEQWRFLAGKLRESLPVEDGRYVPYPECDQKSIAVFAGTFPYPAVQKDDLKQQAAMDDFLNNENSYGNMYPVGNSVCVWYAGWKGLAFARLGDMEKTMTCIEQAAGEANCFSEIFEISNPVHHPWFTTAEGTYVNMVNESLLQSSDHEIRILAQGMKNCSFKLPAVGGVTVEANVQDGIVTSLVLTSSVPYNGIVLFTDKQYEVELEAAATMTLITEQPVCVGQ